MSFLDHESASLFKKSWILGCLIELPIDLQWQAHAEHVDLLSPTWAQLLQVLSQSLVVKYIPLGKKVIRPIFTIQALRFYARMSFFFFKNPPMTRHETLCLVHF